MKNLKKTLSLLLALVMVFSLCATAALAAPPAAPTKESDDYTGPIIDYPDKELWFDSTIYGGFYSAYQIVKGNGDDTFDIDAFINSKQGELILSRIKYELCLVGDQNYNSEAMINYWAEKGIIQTAYNRDEIVAVDDGYGGTKDYRPHEWLTFVPDYMHEEENAGKTYPVVFCFHGSGGSLFEAIDHGFVDICYEEGFIVVVPENENSEGSVAVETVPEYLNQMEAMGYPIDRTRVYTSGMSKGGLCSFYTAQNLSGIVAAAAGHGCAFTFNADFELQEFEAGFQYNEMPMYMAIGTSDMNQLPLNESLLSGINAWSAALGGSEIKLADNVMGIETGNDYTLSLDGTTYYVHDVDTEDGQNVMKLVAVDGLPHWVSYSYSKLAWDFMSQYSIVDGERVYTEKTASYYGDVDNGADYAAAVQTVTEAGLMQGTGTNTFTPDGVVTRAQVVTTLGRLAGAVATDIYGVVDVKAGSWYSGYVGWAVANGLVALEGDRFNPNATLTGTELDKILTAYAELTGVDYIEFPDSDLSMSFGPTGPVFAPSTEPVTRAVLAQRLVKLMNAPVDYDYPDKELWYNTALYGGFMSPYQIFMGNGSSDFDMPAFVNSKIGEDTLNRIKYELCILGDQNYASEYMINYWASQGIVEKVYNRDDIVEKDDGYGGTKDYRPNEWIAYIPDYIKNDGTSTEKYPVVFCFHGGGGSLFEATNHGFVEICYDEGFIVIVPENNNMEHDLTIANLTNYVQILADEGYPVDFDRIYTSGHSMGGIASMACAIRADDVVAASSATGCVGLGIPVGPDAMGGLDWSDFEAAGEAPMYFMVGGKEMAPHLPLTDAALEGFNAWLNQNGCSAAVRTEDNALGFTADRINELEIDEQTYTFAEYYNADGELVVVFVLAENTTHWAPYSHAKLAWNFLKDFTNK